jgi:hypothetical protein
MQHACIRSSEQAGFERSGGDVIYNSMMQVHHSTSARGRCTILQQC